MYLQRRIQLIMNITFKTTLSFFWYCSLQNSIHIDNFCRFLLKNNSKIVPQDRNRVSEHTFDTSNANSARTTQKLDQRIQTSKKKVLRKILRNNCTVGNICTVSNICTTYYKKNNYQQIKPKRSMFKWYRTPKLWSRDLRGCEGNIGLL